jgi:hypothetical protein
MFTDIINFEVYNREYLDKVNSPYLIAVDFDETLCMQGWPNIQHGKPINTTINKMKGRIVGTPKTIFILWTCREFERMEDAKWWIKENNIPIFYFNEQHPSSREWLDGYHSRKIFAHEYWDDRAVYMGRR